MSYLVYEHYSMKNNISSKRPYTTIGTEKRIKYSKSISMQHFFQQCQIRNPLENPKTYKVDYSLYPLWVKWIDRIIEFFEKVTGKEF